MSRNVKTNHNEITKYFDDDESPIEYVVELYGNAIVTKMKSSNTFIFCLCGYPTHTTVKHMYSWALREKKLFKFSIAEKKFTIVHEDACGNTIIQEDSAEDWEKRPQIITL